MDKKILLLCGTGGVGKTTLAAAFAVKAASQGKKVALITVDPAKRLANALGLNTLESEPQDLDIRSLGKNTGSLAALMLDSQATLENFLEKAGGKTLRDQFKESELFRIISDNFGGTHDYLALEKLYSLSQDDRFDTIILDTPPARHTLDFLYSPERIGRFFSDTIFQWFLVDPRSHSLRERLRAKGTSAALQLLEKLTGEGVIHDFIRLAPHIQKVKTLFVERQNAALAQLRSPHAGAYFVTAPFELRRTEAEPFLAETRRQGITVRGGIINRSLAHLQVEKEVDAPASVLAIYRNLDILIEEEKKNVAILQKLMGKTITLVPEQNRDIHSLPSLLDLAAPLPNDF
jgi:anion-transporting  ArsA/GET3 family ATPase